MITNSNTIEEMCGIAKSRGGKCLSEKYTNSKTKLIWECSHGHQWETIPNVIKRGSWCPHCAGNVQINIQELKEIAESKNGECLSEEYISAMKKITWKCENQHIFQMNSNAVKNGAWCPQCYNQRRGNSTRLTIDEMRKIAESRSGKCLSDIYINSKTKLNWLCSEGHEWLATPNMIKQGKWCPQCNPSIKLTIEYMQKFAEQKGGRCLSKEYVNSRTIMKWKCKEGHIWESTYSTIRNVDRWCPQCNPSWFLNEGKCKYVIEKLTGKKFKKNRIILGENLELDGYNKELNMAFEYNGKQHYEFVEFFHRTHDEFKRKLEVDKKKRQLCKENGIKLVIIPYTCESDKDMLKYIAKQLNIKNISDFSFQEYYESGVALKDLKDIAISKGGECLSDSYVSNSTKMKWKCSNGHIWLSKPNSIKNGHWCLECSGNKRKTIEDMIKLAKSKDGEFLSVEYKGANHLYKWKCKNGHAWENTAAKITSGQWCKICAGKAKGSILEMRKIAEERGGKCLSDSYINGEQKLMWMCKRKHTWEAVPNNVKNLNSWCPECAGVKKPTIDEMKMLAREKSGECLSLSYINAHTKLLWKCVKEHIWEAKPNDIKNGHWCPICGRERAGEKIRERIRTK